MDRTAIQDQVKPGTDTAMEHRALRDTVIGDVTKMSNLVVIADDCRIGRNCMISSFVGIAGSPVLKVNMTMADAADLPASAYLGQVQS